MRRQDPATDLLIVLIYEDAVAVDDVDQDQFTRRLSDVDANVVDVLHTRDGRVVAHPSWLRVSRPLAELGRPNQQVELAWLWLRHQPNSALTHWFLARTVKASKRIKRIAIVALARKLMVALWRYLETGLVPRGATLRAAG